MTTKAEALKRVDELEKKVEERIAGIGKRLEGEEMRRKEAEDKYEELRKTDNKLISNLQSKLDGLAAAKPAYEALKAIVEPAVRDALKGVGNPGATGSQPVGNRDATLVRVKTTVHVKEEKRTLPEYSTLEVTGKVLDLIVKKKLTAPKRVSEITEMIPGLTNVNVAKACDSLVSQGLLLVRQEDRTHKAYGPHPDVEYTK